MTEHVISMGCVEDKLTAQDDLRAWKEILAVVSEEFLERYNSQGQGKQSWFLRIGACSHWVRPHQSRWTAAGGFAMAVGYKGATGWSCGLPELDWSVVVTFDGERWRRVEKFSGKRQIVLRVAVPSRTARHKQAAIHTVWSTAHKFTHYGFRNIGDKWVCVAASDERKRGRLLCAEEQIPQG